ncbi:MAG: hypothetical protein ACO4CH_03845 [Saprospiraceae bacterium]
MIFISFASVSAQAPERFTYQAVIRDSDNTIIRNTTIGLRLSILRDSSTSMNSLYSETHTLTTNGNGLITTEIGGGSVQSGDFASIQWGNGIYFIKTEIDTKGGSNYGISGVTRVLSVPYALFSSSSMYSDSSRATVFSDSARISSYSDSARATVYSDSSAYSDTSGVSIFSDSARISSYSDSARATVYSDSSAYSDTSAVSTYSDSARVAHMLPRMTTSQRDSIKNPPEGLQIYNLTSHCLELNMGSSIRPEWFQIGCLGTVDSLYCEDALVSQVLKAQKPSEGRTLTIPYTNGNSGDFPEKVFLSQDVSGISLRLQKGRLRPGDENLSMEFSGTPQDTGTAVFLIDVATKTCSLEVSVVAYPTGYTDCLGSGLETEIIDVKSATNKVWMDRNLGASRAAT